MVKTIKSTLNYFQINLFYERVNCLLSYLTNHNLPFKKMPRFKYFGNKINHINAFQLLLISYSEVVLTQNSIFYISKVSIDRKRIITRFKFLFKFLYTCENLNLFFAISIYRESTDHGKTFFFFKHVHWH